MRIIHKLIITVLFCTALPFAQPGRTASPLPELPIPDSLVVQKMNVKNTEIRDLLQGMAVQYGLNLFLEKDVAGPVTINFNNRPLKDALKVLLAGNGYEYKVENGVIHVFKPIPPEPEKPKPPEKKFDIRWEGEKLSVDVEDAQFAPLIRKIMEETGRNVFVEQPPNHPVTLFLKDMEFGKAMEYIARAADLEVSDEDGSYVMARAGWAAGSRGEASGKFRVKYTGNLLNIDAMEAPLSDLVSEILAQTKINAMVYGKLDGSASAHVEGISIQDALKYLFRGTPYTFWVRDGVYFIGPHEMQTADNSLLIKLKHLKAEDVITLLPTTLTKNTQIQVVKSQNALMAVGRYDVLDAISQYVDKMDLPVAQILIEVLVVDMDIEKGHSHGMNMLFGNAAKLQGSETLFPSVDQTFNRSQTQSFFDGIGLGDVVRIPKDFVLKIQAMEQEKILDVKARSQIATLNGETAVLTIGQSQYYMLSSEVDYNQGDAVTAKTTQRFEKIEANSNITVTPYVTGDGEITCEIVPDFSEPEGSFSSEVPPTLNKRYVKSSVRLLDGETIVLGGMVKESVNDVHRQFPFLGSIPIIGWLFRNVERVRSKSQLLIFVTPHIYYGKEGGVNVETEIEKLEKEGVIKKNKQDEKKKDGKKRDEKKKEPGK